MSKDSFTQLTWTGKCSQYQRLLSIDAGIIRKKKTLTSSRCQLTQDENAAVQLQDPFSTEIEVYRYLVDCRLSCSWVISQMQLAVDFGDTKRQYERQINCKINAHMPSVWVEQAELLSPSIFEKQPKRGSYRLQTHRLSAHRKFFWRSLLILTSKFCPYGTYISN